MLQDAYHDVPWSEPAVVMACMKKPSNLSTWRPRLRWLDEHSRAGLNKG